MAHAPYTEITGAARLDDTSLPPILYTIKYTEDLDLLQVYNMMIETLKDQKDLVQRFRFDQHVNQARRELLEASRIVRTILSDRPEIVNALKVEFNSSLDVDAVLREMNKIDGGL